MVDPYAEALLRLHLTRCFSVGTARRLGLPPHVLRRTAFTRESRSVRSFAGSGADLSDVVACLGGLSPGTVASHTTAALLWGLPLPRRSQDAPIHLTRPSGAAQPRRSGVIGHVSRLRDVDAVTVYGVPLTSPARTWCDLAAQLSLTELVAAGDALLRRPDAPRLPAATALPNPLTGLPELTTTLASRSGARGIALARKALPLLRTGVDSAAESRLRLLIVGAGLPEPEVNEWILDDQGRRVSRPDLQYRARRIALEYEGEHHLRDAHQWAHDIERDERLQRLGWTVLRFTKIHLGSRRQDAVARIRRALESCGAS
ncbi:DUF559 domain-containing protein [Arthrobacter echini]|uniref:DUF559 domain-containing protein n=1 Tax=Arthrobacter echini TaxID=1529066 RepID=A0A4S5E8E6_9MICC|nr:DUF559 domain-containing protein [Arthrobacter echini]THJ67937.1 DUF559 domain-containing protein [Arthrobacter echini]